MSTSYTTTCRDIDQLTPLAQKAIRLFFYLCHQKGIKIFVTETYRSQERQNYLYAQGRTRPGNVVTWTLKSRHKSRMAWDIAASQLGGNTNIYNTAIIKKAGAIARSIGITWGGDWKNAVDYPHFEIPDNWTFPKGYDMTGKVVSIPTGSKAEIKVVSSVNKLPQVDKEIPDNKLEEELQVAKQVLLRDVGNPTLRTSAVTFLEKSLAAGLINSDTWVKEAKEGTLSMDALTLLHIHCTLNGSFVGQSTSGTLKANLVKKFEEAFEENIITNKDWVDKAKAGSLSIIDAVLLEQIIDERRANTDH